MKKRTVKKYNKSKRILRQKQVVSRKNKTRQNRKKSRRIRSIKIKGGAFSTASTGRNPVNHKKTKKTKKTKNTKNNNKVIYEFSNRLKEFLGPNNKLPQIRIIKDLLSHEINLKLFNDLYLQSKKNDDENDDDENDDDENGDEKMKDEQRRINTELTVINGETDILHEIVLSLNDNLIAEGEAEYTWEKMKDFLLDPQTELTDFEPPDQRNIVLNAIQSYTNDGWKALKSASAELKDDREIVLKAVKQNWRALEYASAAQKEDREIVLEAVKENRGALLYASCKLKEDRDILLEADK